MCFHWAAFKSFNYVGTAISFSAFSDMHYFFLMGLSSFCTMQFLLFFSFPRSYVSFSFRCIIGFEVKYHLMRKNSHRPRGSKYFSNTTTIVFIFGGLLWPWQFHSLRFFFGLVCLVTHMRTQIFHHQVPKMVWGKQEIRRLGHDNEIKLLEHIFEDFCEDNKKREVLNYTPELVRLTMKRRTFSVRFSGLRIDKQTDKQSDKQTDRQTEGLRLLI